LTIKNRVYNKRVVLIKPLFFRKELTMSDAKSGRGKYTPTPVSVTFPATFPNDKLAGKTVTYAGRGRKPTWWETAIEAGLIATEEKDEAATDTAADAPAADAKA
jgi:DNA-binding protein H-NS